MTFKGEYQNNNISIDETALTKTDTSNQIVEIRTEIEKKLELLELNRITGDNFNDEIFN